MDLQPATAIDDRCMQPEELADEAVLTAVQVRLVASNASSAEEATRQQHSRH